MSGARVAVEAGAGLGDADGQGGVRESAGVMDYSNRARAPIHAVSSTQEFRAAIKRTVGPADVVLEVGCADGVTTEIISKFAADVVGVDIAAAVVAKARARFGGLDFRVVDGLDLEGLAALRPRFTKVFVDTAGTSAVEALLPMLRGLDHRLRPALLVVKSRALAQLSAQLGAGGAAGAPAAEAGAAPGPAALPKERLVAEGQRGRVGVAVQAALAAGGLGGAERLHECGTPWPFRSTKPPRNPGVRHAACQPPGALLRMVFYACGPAAEGAGGEPGAGGAALRAAEGGADRAKRQKADSGGGGEREVVCVVAPLAGELDAAAVAVAAGAGAAELATRAQLCESVLGGGRETALLYAVKRYRMCPLLLQDGVRTLVAREAVAPTTGAAGPAEAAFEVGFGRYVVVSTEELRAACERKSYDVVCGLLK
jgi:SAM-dependent methyltransferase